MTDGGGTRVKVVGSSGKEAEIDFIERALNILTSKHHRIHEGRQFFIDDADLDVDTNTPKYWLLVTPREDLLNLRSLKIHLTIEGVSSGAGTWSIFEDSLINEGDEGEKIDVINHDRTSENQTDLFVYRNPIINNEGNRIAVVIIPTSSRIEGGIFKKDELILKQDTKYLIKFSPSFSNTKVSINLEWYHDQILPQSLT